MKKSLQTLKAEAVAATEALAQAVAAELADKKLPGFDIELNPDTGEVRYYPSARSFTRAEAVEFARAVMEQEGWEF